MPMDKDPQGGGTEADGGKSVDYCSYCYQNGTFTNPDFTAKQMQDFCVAKLREMGTPGLVAWFLTRRIPKLKRWRS